MSMICDIPEHVDLPSVSLVIGAVLLNNSDWFD